MAYLTADAVWYEYSGQGETVAPAVKGVSLQVEKGEWLAIIGHNGSGKSTLAKMLNGLYLPAKGDVVVDGMNTRQEEHIWDIRQRVGMVFQNPDNQIVATVVEEDVAFGLENLGVEPREIARRVKEALEAVGMQAYAASAPHMLSGGQKQRVAIAGIIAMRPSVILLDEPTAMLDPSGRAEVMETMERLNREAGITVVHITHFMEEALRASRVMVMEDGVEVMQGAPREVFMQVERLKALGLDVPRMAELAHNLRARGVDLPKDIMTVKEMVNALCPYKP